MSDYYFDIETYGKGDKVDFDKDEIITIQYQQIDSRTGIAKSPLTILKAWESSEQDILKKFYTIFAPNELWNFIPVGFNLSYDFAKLILRYKLVNINLSARLIFSEHPYLDIRPLVIFLNGGMFKGATLENYAGKDCSGERIKGWYEAKDYNSITKYIENETKCFLSLYQYLIKILPDIGQEYIINQC
jgi:hypothetical protein